MSFQVRSLRRAEQSYNQLLGDIAERSKVGATDWAKSFDRALARLEESPDTFPCAAESELVEMDVRDIFFKTRRGLVCRILFTIRGRDVLVLHVRGPGQNLLRPDQLDRGSGDDP
jgi:hypothetical protein